MSALILLNKPFQVLCQFRDSEGRATLADFVQAPGFYPAGRLDRDSEGLVVLTDDGRLQQRIAHPANKLVKVYWVQVEGIPAAEALSQLAAGPRLKDGPCRPAEVRRLEAPALWPRHPPVRQRVNQPTAWLEVRLSEGRNRQVRRMTAAVGHPTLRLVRVAVGPWRLGNLAPGEWQWSSVHLPRPGHRAWAAKGRRRRG